MTAPDAPPETVAVLFFAYGMYAAVDWLYSKVPVRFPKLKIALSEGGIGWVAGLIDRLDHCFAYQLGYLPTWRDVDLTPSEVLRRNFWFCAIDDTSGFLTRDVIGVDHLLVESDYPHADSTWPDARPHSSSPWPWPWVPSPPACRPGPPPPATRVAGATSCRSTSRTASG